MYSYSTIANNHTNAPYTIYMYNLTYLLIRALH